jgi:hypothetical protein
MKRRRLLAAGAAVPVLAMTDGLPALTNHAPIARVGWPEVAAIHQLALDLELSHPLALGAAESALQRAAAMLHARVRPDVLIGLHEAVALLADRVGWGQYEAGHDATAALSFAQRTARRGNDSALVAHAMLDIAVSTPDPRLAVATLEHALTEKVSGAERVNLHAVAARRSAIHDRRAAREHLAHALDLNPTPAENEWSNRITSAAGHLDAIIGFACHTVGHDDAETRLRTAVARLAPVRGRTRARCHARLASIALVGGDATGAEAHLRLVSQARRSRLVASDLRDFAVTARQAGRPDLARQAERAPRADA